MESNFKRVFLIALGVLALFAVPYTITSMVEWNESGNISVVQSVSGEMSVVIKEGPFFQGFGRVTTYQRSRDWSFCNTADSNCDDPDMAAPKVIFNDNSTALVSGNLRYQLPLTEPEMLALHRTFGGQEAFERTVLSKLITEAVRQTAGFMKAEESFSSRSAEFTDVAREQLRDGIYAKTSRETQRPTESGGTVVERHIEVKVDPETKKPVISESSPFSRYGVTVDTWTVTYLDYDEETDKLINERKNTQQKALTARAEAETAKQNAITEEEKGKALVAKERAAKEVEKISAVTAAEKEYEVARLAALAAQEEGKKKLAIARAEAEGNALKAKAGLTPQEEAEFEMKTKIGMAEAFSKTQLPKVVNISGGGGKSNDGDLMLQALGVDALLRVQDRFEKKD